MTNGITIIAEIGSVHDGSFGNACKLIDLSAKCGVDVVKFQTHIAAAETLRDAPMPSYFKGEPRFSYFERTAFDRPQLRELKARAVSNNIKFLSSPFSLEAVDLLEEIGVDSYKIPSGEVSNIPLLEHVARTRKPTYLSSGMSNWNELDAAVAALRPGGPLYVLQCTSAYPCPPERVGLNVLAEMKQRYDLPVGFSDHTLGSAAAFAAAACGATVVEKHLTFSRAMYGSDAANAMEPDDFTAFCTGLREIARMRASPVDKDDLSALTEMKSVFEKSAVVAKALPAGAKISLDSLAFKKPGDGIPAARYRELIGKIATRALPADHKLSWDDVRD
jgi:N-acetylneuraminate synthase